jgi:hypothetical protein
MSINKKRLVFLTLESKEPVHMEILSSEEEINKIINLLEKNYLFQYFSVVPVHKESK